MKTLSYGLTVFTLYLIALGSLLGETKEVVLLNSYHYGLVWTDGITKTISSELEEHGIVLEVEYMDSKRHPYDAIKSNFHQYLKGKYSDKKIDVVIAADNNALSFLNEYTNELFPGSLIVFCGINNYSSDLTKDLTQKYTGVVEETDPLETIELINILQPYLKKLVVVSGETPTGVNLKQHTVDSLKEFVCNFEIEWWSDLSMRELCARSENLGNHDAILLLTFNRDSEGVYYNYTDAPTQIAQVSSVPLYGLWDFYLGAGIVGGKIITSTSQGSTAASLCLKYLQKGVIPEIVKTSPNESVVIYDELLEAGIDPEKVPLDIQVINRPVISGDIGLITSIMGIAAFIVMIFVLFAVFSSSHITKSKLKLSIVLRNNTVAVLGITVFLIITILVFVELRSFKKSSVELRNELFLEKKNLIEKSVKNLMFDIRFLSDFYDLTRDPKHELLKQYTENRIQSIAKNDEYFFIINSNGKVLYHPAFPEIIGKNFTEDDQDLRSGIVKEMLKVASHPNGGFLTYNWQKKGIEGQHGKIAFLKKLEAFDWIIGYGVYINDIELELIDIQEDLRNQLMRSIAVALLAGFLSFCLLLFISRITEHRISKEINLLYKGIAAADCLLLKHNFRIAEFDSISSHALNVFDQISKSQEKSFLLTRAIEKSPVSVAITDRDGKIEYVNTTFCAMSGRNSKDVIGQNHKILDPNNFTPETYKNTLDTILNGGLWVGEFQNERKKGEFVWQSVSISGVQADEGQISHILEVKEDITEKKQLQTKLLHSQKLESVGNLAAGVAHEINTPIQYISDNLQFLKTSFQDILALAHLHKNLIKTIKTENHFESEITAHEQAFEDTDFDFIVEELPRAIDQSVDGTDKVAQIVRAMKAFAQPASDDMKQMDLNDAIRTTITVTRNEWRYLANLETDFDPSLIDVPGIASELNQVLLNMIINARDAIAETKKQGMIKVTTTREADHAVIIISDTGIGMPQEVQARVFDPFYTTKEVDKGMGQGLSIAHNVIVAKHSGEINILKSDSSGTAFEIRLPLIQKKDANG